MRAQRDRLKITFDSAARFYQQARPNYPDALYDELAGTPIKVGPGPDFVAITPDGKTAYVAVSGHRGLGCPPTPKPCRPGPVVPIDTATDTPGKPIRHLGFVSQIAITPDGKTAYALNPYTVIPISTATDTAGKPFSHLYQPTVVSITPDGKTAYVSHPLSRVTPISTATNTEGAPIRPGRGPGYMAFTPDGKTAYVSIDGNPPAAPPAVTPINTATGKAGTQIPIGVAKLGACRQQEISCYSASQMAITPDGKMVYLDGDILRRSGGRIRFFAVVVPISTATNTAAKPLLLGPSPGESFIPSCIVITPDGKTAYVTTQNSVIPISTATSKPGKPINVGPGAAVGITITP